MNILNNIFLLVIEVNDSERNEIYDNKILYLKTLNINIIFLVFKSKSNEKITELDYECNIKFNFKNLKYFIENNKIYYDNLIVTNNFLGISIENVLSNFNKNQVYKYDHENKFCYIIPENEFSINNDFEFKTFKTIDIKFKNELLKLNIKFNQDIKCKKKYKFPLISIIMTVYNSENTIEYAIKSILNQSYKNFEFIIVNDCSTDNSENIILKYKNLDKRIKSIKNKKNYGCYISKNIGLNKISSDTKYIAFQDSDDISHSSRIFKQICFMIDNKLLLSTCLFYETKQFKMPMISMIFEKIVFEKIGYFSEDRFGQDEDYYLRYFTLFENNWDYNVNLIYNNKNSGFFSNNCKYYKNLNQVLYKVTRHKKSLTKVYPNRIELSKKLNKKYLNLESSNLKTKFQFCCKKNINFSQYLYFIDNRFINNSIFPNEIKQAYVSESLNHLKTRFLEKFNLEQFNTFYKPCIFFGIYNSKDIYHLNRLKNNKYIIWGGTDLDHSYKERKDNYCKITNIKDINHYAISSNIQNRLNDLNISSKLINLSLVDVNLFYPLHIKGSLIYIFDGLSKNNREIYGYNVIKKVIQLMPNYEFIFSSDLNINYSKMNEIYKKCFIGLRLTSKDGNANTVQEMIHMKLPVIHNGDYDTIKWKDEYDIVKSIKSYIPKYLIIFRKNMNLHDGSYVWLINFIKLLKYKCNICKIYVLCSDIDKKLSIENVIFLEELSDITFKFDHIFYRITNNTNNFTYFDNVTLVLHKFRKNLVNYYNKFKYICVNSILIKDELILNDIKSKINILPPLIDKINYDNNNKINLNFCYCGTLKQSYFSLEILTLFYKLSEVYNFTFNLIYSKIHLEDNNEYISKLNLLINNLKKHKNFYIYNDVGKDIMNEILLQSQFGIVSHTKDTDFKQQSTKLIEYLSFNCIPIYYLTYLNCGYINNNLSFSSIIELKDILNKILTNNINYSDIKINYNKLKSHLISDNIKNLEFENISYITKNIVKNSNKIIITNSYENMFLNKKVIFINPKLDFNIHSVNIFNFFENNDYEYYYDILITNFKIKSISSYKINYREKLFDYEYDYMYPKYNNILCQSSILKFNDLQSSIQMKLLLEKGYEYIIEIELNIKIDGVLFVMIINNNNIDINRKLHFIDLDNNNLQFITRPKETQIYLLMLKQSKKNNKSMQISIKKFKISRIVDINNLCQKIKVINLDREFYKFQKLKKCFEYNGILVERQKAVDGKDNKIIEQYNKYSKNVFSPCAYAYILTMIQIFKNAIYNNYEYIMITDDDIGISNNFKLKFNEILENIFYNFRLLMLGSSQWDWFNVDINRCNNYYKPNELSNGSFCNLYHRITFETILKNINFDSPFDVHPMKSNFKKGNCYVAYPNIVIAQLETSNIKKINTKIRNYERFKWIKSNYIFDVRKSFTYLSYKKNNKKKNKLTFIIGIVTFNRVNYLKKCISSLLESLSNEVDYILIFANGNSSDDTSSFINNLEVNDNISVYHIINEDNFIYRQSNSILLFSENFNYDFGFIINDDLLFIQKEWDKRYYNAYKKYDFDHLVYFDYNFKRKDHHIKENILESFCKSENCMGALFTFTKKLVKEIGYFDEENFKIRGHSHIDFTIRCCRKKFNNNKNLYDIKDSTKYITLIKDNYVSTFSKIPFYLRELFKVDYFEEERRMKIINDNTRLYINKIFDINYNNLQIQNNLLVKE